MSELLKSALGWLLNHPEQVATSVLAGVALARGLGLLKAHMSEKRFRQIAALAHVAFHAVEEAAKTEESLRGAAKLALFLDKLDTALEANGGAPLSDAERSLASDVAAALNAAPKAAPGPSQASAN